MFAKVAIEEILSEIEIKLGTIVIIESDTTHPNTNLVPIF